MRGLEDELRRLQVTQDGIVTASELVLTGAYALRVQQLIEGQLVKVEEARLAVFEARERYIQANKDAKALEMLKDKKREEYQQELLKEEINQLDEVASQRAGAKD